MKQPSVETKINTEYKELRAKLVKEIEDYYPLTPLKIWQNKDSRISKQIHKLDMAYLKLKLEMEK
jgi:hypothetical protein